VRSAPRDSSLARIEISRIASAYALLTPAGLPDSPGFHMRARIAGCSPGCGLMDCQNKRENGESSTHRLSENVQRPETSAGITRQIVERDEAGFDRPRPCCASHPAGAPEPRQQPGTRWNALIARPRRYAQCRAIGRRNGERQSQLR
jgi:hypothetical protein